MTAARLRILVISDLHAHASDPLASSSPSYYSTDSRYRSKALNPLFDLSDLIRREGLKVDWVVSPGDLGDRANVSAQKSAWDDLKDIKSKLGASLLIGTAGNHDIDSRRAEKDFDPKTALQLLDPLFPIDEVCFQLGDRVYADRYWSRNFVVVPFKKFDATLVIINSSAFHGYSSDVNKAPDEHLHGRISPQTLDAISAAVESSGSAINVALLHHHVKKHPWIEDGGSVAKGGDRLLELLKETERPWLVLHGHEHVPHLSYSDATPFAPIVLSAGSVAAKTYRVRGGHPRNQIHHIEIDPTHLACGGVNLMGLVKTWTWSPEVGWSRAQGDAGLPYECGFGYRADMGELRDRLITFGRASAGGFSRWAQVLTFEPRLAYLTPDDQTGLFKMLKAKGAKLQFDDEGQPSGLEVS